MRILLVEDEIEFADTVRGALERERFVVDHVDRLTLAREAARSVSYDLVLLDRTLPDGDGLSLVAALRAGNPGLPIIVLSARGELLDRVVGLDEGADDYLVKPFALEEMFARMRAVSRRPADLGAEEIMVGALVLAALVKRRGRTVLRESLERAVYGFDDEVQSNTLDSHISRLRRKLTEAGARIEIHAIRGVGYLLREPS
jgi:DNA-binding response OmpR family regulator